MEKGIVLFKISSKERKSTRHVHCFIIFFYCGIECETNSLGMRPLMGPLYLHWMMNGQVALGYDK